jgi:hypothetical protein
VDGRIADGNAIFLVTSVWIRGRNSKTIAEGSLIYIYVGMKDTENWVLCGITESLAE